MEYKTKFKAEDLQFPIWGVTEEQLGKKNIEAMLNGRYSEPFTITAKTDSGELKESIARIYLIEEEGKAKSRFMSKNEELVIAELYKGVPITDTDKTALLEGKAVWKEGLKASEEGKPYDRWITVDKALNRIAQLTNDQIKSPKEILEVTLNSEQALKFSAGERFYIEGMKNKAGKTMSATIHKDLITGILHFEFPKAPAKVVDQKTTESKTEKVIEVKPEADKITDRKSEKKVLEFTEGYVEVTKDIKAKKEKPLEAPKFPKVDASKFEEKETTTKTKKSKSLSV